MDEPALVRKLHDEGRYRDALAVARRVLRIQPDHGDTLFWASSCLLVLGERGPALGYARRASAAEPFNVYKRVWLAQVHAWRGERRSAMGAIREALALEPQNLFVHRRHAWVLLKLGRHAQAADAAREALRLDAHDRESLDLLAQAFTHLGRHEDAVGVTRAALAQDPEHPPAHARLGWIGLSGGAGGDAVAHFREALRLNPQDARSREGLLHALRARFFLYRWPLRLVFWFGSRPRRARVAILFGGFFGFLLVGFVASGTLLGSVATALGYSWILVLASGYRLVQPFVDLVLRFDPGTVRLMKRKEVIRADLLAVLILFVALAWLPIPDLVKALLVLAPVLAMPVWHAVTWPNVSTRRTVRWGAAAALLAPALYLGVALVAFPEYAPVAIAILVLSWILFLVAAARLALRDGI